jgi:peptide/nickel transport system permease protein
VCKAASTPVGGRIVVQGHGKRQRQAWGPRSPREPPEIQVLLVRRYHCIVCGAAMTVAEELYVEAARSVGVGHLRILVFHILPNITAPIAVQITISLAYAILVESSLSYLGLGVQPPDASWGLMLSSGKVQIERSIWPSVVPGLFIVFTVLGFNLLGDALRDALDPRMRAAMR